MTACDVVIGVDVGGTKIAVGAVTRAGEIVESERYPMDRATQETSLASIDAALDSFMSSWCGPRPLALGFGLVGSTDPATGTWLRSMNIPISDSVDMTARFGAPYGLRAAVDNDVHAATLAELRWGAGGDASDFIYLNVGTGTAAGLVTHGRLVRGASNYAGEFGHTYTGVAPDVQCPCGRRGCLEPAASGGGLITRARELLPAYLDSPLAAADAAGQLNAHTIFVYADAGDPLAARLAEDMVNALGIAVTNLINLLDPQVVVVGGGVWADGWLLPRVQKIVQSTALRRALSDLRGLVPSTLHPDHVGLLGAATLAWDILDERKSYV
ncbi:MAG: ROK family protein [Anaerolineales bacterium]